MSERADQLKQDLEQRIKALAESVDTARKSEMMQTWLKSIARFHKYSFLNSWLILSAMPDATRVAGYTDWIEKHHRQVKKGEHGIPIFAPLIRKEETDEGTRKVLYGFRIVTVFDVSQTEGEPLPDVPTWTSPEQDAALQNRLTAYAESLGLTVSIESLKGETQGQHNRRTHEIKLDPAAGTKTLIHEIAHAILHSAGSITRDSAEQEAEAVAYAVTTWAGLPADGSANYIALWNGSSEEIIKRMNLIRDTAHQIIEGLQPCNSEH